MGLPTSGTISANMINDEVPGRSATANAPLSGTSSTPQAGSLVKLYQTATPPVNQVAPHAYSEFYGRSFVSTTSYSSSSMGVFNQACAFNGSNPCCTQTYYHNGSGTLPTAGDTCYSDAAATSPLLDGYYNINAAIGTGNRLYIRLSGGNTGVVESGYPQYC